MPTYIAWDLETTGLEPGSRPIELAAVAYEEEDGALRSTRSFSTFINPDMPIPTDATALHGITNEDVRRAPYALIALDRFADFIGDFSDAILIGHNITGYDCSILSWIAAHYRAAGVHGFERLPLLDTCTLSRMKAATKKHSLDFLVQHWEIALCGPPHRALTDAYAAGDLFRRALYQPDLAPVPWVTEYRYPEALPDSLSDLTTLVAEAKPFAFEYEDSKGEVTERAIIPYGWAEKGDDNAVYFHGLCTLRGERRTFRADRVRKVLGVTEAA